jgi:uncharacterized protein
VPPLTARVTDLTGTLSGQAVNRIEAKLADLRGKKGSQIAVLIVPTTQPEDIEQYGIRVEDAWKLGRKGVDDGAILLVAKNDHRVRIEVGRGLEGALPDAIAGRIIAETITPHFKLGDYDGGVEAGVDQMISVVSGEPLPEPDKKWERTAAWAICCRCSWWWCRGQRHVLRACSADCSGPCSRAAWPAASPGY